MAAEDFVADYGFNTMSDILLAGEHVKGLCALCIQVQMRNLST
jgi:hypothetical protein